MKKHLFIACLLNLVFLQQTISANVWAKIPRTVTGGRQKLSLDKGWRFHFGDIPFPVIKGHGMTYISAKAGRAWGAAAPDFDDTNWRLLNLPHDWAVEQPFDSTANLSQGYRQRGISWYRRNFKLDTADRGKHLELQFDGIATHCTVWVNGTVVHRNWCGYTSFYIDLTAVAKYGDEPNSIAIRVDAVDQEGWWYEGAGIYRHTWLVKRDPVHIITDGVFANPVRTAARSWTIPIEATIANSGMADARVEVESTVFDKKGLFVTSNKTVTLVNPLKESTAKFNIAVQNPELWDINRPTLYSVRTIVKQNGKITDSLNTRCGFRTIRFTADSGFFLNDKYMKIQGVCNHQDHAGVGVAVPDALWDFRLRKLKELGVNGYRCAHNPPSNEFLEACDRIGILVMDENRIFNSSPEYMRQLEWMIRRDRNHPSIVLWSVFNEEPQEGTETGYQMVRRMTSLVKTLDTTRPVTAAMDAGQFTPVNVSQAVDVVGFNYSIGNYDRFHRINPNVPMTSSEDVSGMSQRGEYVHDDKKHLLDGYDNEKPDWGNTHRVGWKAIAEKPYLAGCFVWTGFDYRGEPTPFEWPTVNANMGIMDLCGFPKSVYYLHQAQWITEKPILHLIPHWNWPADSVGKEIRVMVLSNAETVKLLLNGKVIGEQKVDKYEMNLWKVPYQPGKLEAIGYKNGKEVSRFKVETTTRPVSVQLIPDRTAIAGDGNDAVPVTVQVLDSNGRPVPTANTPITFEITGLGSIIGVGNGDPNSHESEKENRRKLYNGLAQVILQSKVNASGQLKLIARAEGLKPATLVINVKDVQQIPIVDVLKPLMILNDRWRVSPFSAVRPDPNVDVADYDMNTWSSVKVGELPNFDNGIFTVYRAGFTPYDIVRREGGQITFKDVIGKAEIWLDKTLIGSKTASEKQDVTVDIPPAQGERHISVLIEAQKGTRAGLGGMVMVNAKN
jgi:beta-galactosidase